MIGRSHRRRRNNPFCETIWNFYARASEIYHVADFFGFHFHCCDAMIDNDPTRLVSRNSNRGDDRLVDRLAGRLDDHLSGHLAGRLAGRRGNRWNDGDRPWP